MSRPNLGETTAEFIERAKRERAAEDKAANTPGELTEEDIDNLSAATVSRLVSTTGLPQFGIGPSRRRRA